MLDLPEPLRPAQPQAAVRAGDDGDPTPLVGDARDTEAHADPSLAYSPHQAVPIVSRARLLAPGRTGGSDGSLFGGAGRPAPA